MLRNGQQGPIVGSLPFFFKFRSFDAKQFPTLRIVQKYRFMLPLDSNNYHVMQRTLSTGLDAGYQRTPFFDVRSQVVPLAAKNKRRKARFAQVLLHCRGADSARFLRMQFTLNFLRVETFSRKRSA